VVFIFGLTEQGAHGFHQFRNPFIRDTIVDKIRVLPEINNPLIAEDAQVLRNIGIGCLDFISNLANGHFLVLEQTQNFQADWVGD
jgi:hypothetical protein